MTDFSKLNYLKTLRGRSISASQYRVLVEVFNYTDENGCNAYPGQERLAQDTGLSVRTVRQHLTWLAENGYLIKISRGRGNGVGGSGQCTRYRLNSTCEISSINRQVLVNQPDDLCQSTGDYSPTIRSSSNHLSDQRTEKVADATSTAADALSFSLGPRNNETDTGDARRCPADGCNEPYAWFPFDGLCQRHAQERQDDIDRQQAAKAGRLWEDMAWQQ